MQRRQSQSRTLDRIVRRLVSRFKPDQIILFGSHARGTADADSDVDLLVVMPLANRKRRQTTLAMQLALQDIQTPKDIIVVTPEEVDRQKNIPGTLIRPALLEGKTLYVRQS
ncbi:MAG: nucleotidyltransferase domain-containing protein [Anaerolineales bacterium]